MKRLIKKSNQQVVDKNPNFIPMGELDEADIKNNRCPICKTNKESLQKIDGFKVCPTCGSKFKMFDGDGFTVVK